MRRTVDCIALISGGIDSFVSIHLLKDIFQIKAVYVNLFHLSHKMEYYHAIQICKYLDIEFICIDMPNYSTFFLNSLTKEDEFTKEYFPGRNLLLLTIAASIAQENKIHQIIFGVIKSRRIFPDCSIEFFKNFENIVKLALNFEITINLPVIDYTKDEIFLYCKDHNLPVDISYSCQKGGTEHCLKCPSCIERFQSQKKVMD